MHAHHAAMSQGRMMDPRSPMMHPRSPMPHPMMMRKGFDPRSPVMAGRPRSPVPTCFHPYDPRSPMMNRSPMIMGAGFVHPRMSPVYLAHSRTMHSPSPMRSPLSPLASPTQYENRACLDDALASAGLSPCCPGSMQIPGFSPLSPKRSSPFKVSPTKASPKARREIRRLSAPDKNALVAARASGFK